MDVIQPTFAGGELSPELYSRVDLAKYATGLRTCRNFLIHPQGGASNRPGTRYVAATKSNESVPGIYRLMPFVFSSEQAYVIELGHQYARFYRNGAQIAYTAKEYDPTASYIVGYVVKSGHYHGWTWNTGQVLYLFSKSTATLSSSLQVRVSDSLNSGGATIGYTASGGLVQTITVHLSSTSSNNTLEKLRAQLRASGDLNDFDFAAGGTYTTAVPGTLPNNAGTYYALTELEGIYKCIDNLTYGDFPLDSDFWENISDNPIVEIDTTYISEDLLGLKYAQSADVLYLVHPDYAPRRLTRYDNDDWRVDLYPFADGPFMPGNSDTSITISSSATAKGAATTLTSSSDIFNSLHVGALFRLRHNISSSVRTVDITTTGYTGESIRCGGTWRIQTRGTWTGSVAVQKSTDGGSTWTTVRNFAHVTDESNWNTYGTESEECLVRLYGTAMTSGTAITTLSTDSFVKTGVAKITAVSTSRLATATIATEIGSTDATWEWAEGSWSDYRGYPSSVVFYQDRLCFASTYAEPQTVWMAETGNYVSFLRNLPLTDTDGVSLNLPSHKLNKIVDMIAFSEIVAFTGSSEWAVGPTSNGVVTPTSIRARCQGYRGSANISPVPIGNRALFVQPQGSVVRDLGYALDSDSYTGDNISIMSSHLFAGHSIVSLAYQQEPDSIVWMVRDDGILLSLIYLREQEVLAWSWHDTDGTVEDVCVIPGDGYDELYLLVKRTINGSTVRFIERMAKRDATLAPSQQYFVDCGYTYSGTATKTLTGLTWLEGKTVNILADGSVVTPRTVSGGTLTLDVEASVVHVGLPYICDLQTLGVELNTNSGTMQGKTVKIPLVTFRFLNSRGGFIGANFTTMDEITQRGGEAYGSATVLFSGDYRAQLDSSYRDGGRVCYRQTDPLPVTISAVIPKVHPGD